MDSSEHLSAFIEVSDKFDKFSDSSGFRRSFLRLEQILSFLPISNIDRKDCVRNIKVCQNKFERRHVLNRVENLSQIDFSYLQDPFVIIHFINPK